MPQVEFSSKRFPGISLLCPQIPTAPELSGTFQFTVGHSYEVTDETLASLVQQMERLPTFFKDDIQMSGAPAIAGAPTVVTPSAPPAALDEVGDAPVADITDLTDEDLELVEIEVGKLLGKTVKEAEPILVATGGSPHLPRTLRVLYLEEVQKHADIQKALKDTAAKLLEQL